MTDTSPVLPRLRDEAARSSGKKVDRSRNNQLLRHPIRRLSGVTTASPPVSRHAVSDETASGWRGFVTDDEYEPAELLILCPDCAQREFGPRQLRLAPMTTVTEVDIRVPSSAIERRVPTGASPRSGPASPSWDARCLPPAGWVAASAIPTRELDRAICRKRCLRHPRRGRCIRHRRNAARGDRGRMGELPNRTAASTGHRLLDRA